MRFRIPRSLPRSILRAAIAANVVVAASAVCYSSIPGNRGNSYQPIGLMESATSDSLTSFGRPNKLPQFVLHAPAAESPTVEDREHLASEVPTQGASLAGTPIMAAPLGSATTDAIGEEGFHRLDDACDLEQEFQGCWVDCPDDAEFLFEEVVGSTIEDREQVRYLNERQLLAWAATGCELISEILFFGRDLAVEAPFDTGAAIARYSAQASRGTSSLNDDKDLGNIFVYVLDRVDALDECRLEEGTLEEDILGELTTIVQTVNPLQSGVQDAVAEINASLGYEAFGCGYDPYDCCFPEEVADSSVAHDESALRNVKMVTEDDFLPFPLKLQWGLVGTASESVDSGVAEDLGVGHCAIPACPEEWNGSEHLVPWPDNVLATRKLIESWLEPHWNVRKWEFVTRSTSSIPALPSGFAYQAPTFRWDAVYGRIDAPMLSEIPIDPCLSLFQDLNAQPNWFRAENANIASITDQTDAFIQAEAIDDVSETPILEPKPNSDRLLRIAEKAWGAFEDTLKSQYLGATLAWQRLSVDSKKVIAMQMKQFGGLLLRSADAIEGNVGLASRNPRQNDGKR
ncbi:hypothetical protein SH449x_000122 [Pirellulaceae bacterium SH449]